MERSAWFDPETVEERLAKAAEREEVAGHQRPVGAEGRYRAVDDYDPVLRWHCRVDGPQMNTDKPR